MNKSELVEAVALEARVAKADAERTINAAISAISKALKKGDRVALVGFGTFAVKKRAARKGHNPATGAVIQIPAKKVVKFSPGGELSSLVK